MTKCMTKELAKALAHDVFHTTPFDATGYHDKTTAQRNLTGKTHYVDTDTLRFHKSRILATYDVAHGSLFALIESCALDMHNTSRGFRFVVFDLGGRTLGRASLEGTYKTRAKAEEALWQWLNAFDVMAHYKARLNDETRRATTRVNVMNALTATMG